MKLLMIYCERFNFTPTLKTLENAPNAIAGGMTDVVAGFIHVEPEDTSVTGKVTTKLVKNLKWLAGKNGTQRILLHSFAHLSDSKAEPLASKAILDRAQERLETAGFEVAQTPYGYFNDLDIKAPGHPLARVFKSL